MRKQFWHLTRGEEKFAFLYVAVSAAVVACAMTYSGIAHLTWWQTMLMLVGLLGGAWATIFSFLEVYRLNRTPEERAAGMVEEEAGPSRPLPVAPPTGEPYPHHEYFTESAGFDQGQLTSRLPDATPLIEGFLGRFRSRPHFQ